MKSLRKQCPEIPVGCRVSHPGSGIAFDGVVKIRKFQWVAKEENRCVVSDKIPVAFIGIEFHGESTDVSLCIRRTSFSSHCGESYKARSLLTDLGENRGACYVRKIFGYCEFTSYFYTSMVCCKAICVSQYILGHNKQVV